MNVKKVVSVTLLVALLSGCGDSRDSVGGMAEARWAAIVDQDYDKAYSYFASSYQQLEDLNTYRLRIATAQVNMKWEGAKAKSVECTATKCLVKLDLSYTYKFPRASMGEVSNITEIAENWINDDGDWKMLPSGKRNL